MELENTHQRIVDVVIHSDCIFSIDNNGNPYFRLFPFNSLF